MGALCRQDHGNGGAFAELVECPADELIDIAVIVGEQHVALDVLGRRAGVMP